MNSLLKVVFDDSLKQLLCCTSPQADRKTSGNGHPGQRSREHYQRQLQALEEGKMKRDEDFAQRKAERAAMRIRLREKYQLRENEQDRQKLKAVSERVEMPVELAAIVNVGKRPESGPSLLAGLPESNLTELAQAAITQLRQTTQRECTLM